MIKPPLSTLLLAASTLGMIWLMSAGCTTAPTPAQATTATVAGATAATTVAIVAPQAALYLQTAAEAIRSVSGAEAPSPERLAAALELWSAAIPALHAEVPKIVAAYTQKVYPTATRAGNALAILEDFAAGVSLAGAGAVVPATH